MMRAAEKFPSSVLSFTMLLIIKHFCLSVSFVGRPFLMPALGNAFLHHLLGRFWRHYYVKRHKYLPLYALKVLEYDLNNRYEL